MRLNFTKLTIGLLCASLVAAPAHAAIERSAIPITATEATTTSSSHAAATVAADYQSTKLMRTEKREARNAIMKALRAGPVGTLLLVILCLLPPLNLVAVLLKEGILNKKFWTALLLTLLLILPGVIYSLLVVLNIV